MLGLKQIESISSWWETESPHFRKCFHVMGLCTSALLTCTQDQQLHGEQSLKSPQRESENAYTVTKSCDPLTWNGDKKKDRNSVVIVRQRWSFLSVPPHQHHCKCKWASRRRKASHDLGTDKCLIHLPGIYFYKHQHELWQQTHHRLSLYFHFPADWPTFKIQQIS